MSSLEEKSKVMKKVSVQLDERFIIEVKTGDMVAAEIVCTPLGVSYSIGTGATEVKLDAELLRVDILGDSYNIKHEEANRKSE